MGFDRRGFIKFIAGGAVGSLFTPIPWQINSGLALWTQSWPWIPRNIDGADNYAHTVSKLCPSGCALKVRTVGGQPVRAIGDPNHPLSGGRISSLAAAEVQLLYSPARVKRPLKKSADGAFVAISWAEAETMLQEKLGGLVGNAGKIACITGEETGTINEVLTGFVAKAGSTDSYVMPCELQTASKVWQDIMGAQGQPGYDIEKANFVLALGADILESWGTVVRNRRAYGASRPHGQQPKAKFVYAGPVQNNTAVGCDQWIPIKPGTQAAFALGLANQLIQAGASFEGPDFAEFKTLAAAYTPDKVKDICGVAPNVLAILVKEIKAASAPLVIPGSEINQGASAATLLAGFACNFLLGGLNKPGGMTALPEVAKVVEAAPERKALFANDLIGFLQAVEKGSKKPEALLIYEANPVYALPQSETMAKALAKIPFKVSFTSFLDETAVACDLVLPMPMGLERIDDLVSPYGCGQALYCAVHPVIKPVVDAKHAGDVLLALAKKLNLNMGFASFKEVLAAKATKVNAKFDDLKNGKFVLSPTQVTQPTPAVKPDVMAAALKATAPDATYPLALAPIQKLNFGSPNCATPPFNLKTIRDTELKGKDFFVQMNKATASKQGLAQGDRIKLVSKAGECRARVHIFEGVMNDVVAAPLGFGHTAYDEFTKGKGDNLAKVLVPALEAGSNIPVWIGAMVKIAKI
jgi:anaerobic selenocysteine-containing dehydrogenase